MLNSLVLVLLAACAFEFPVLAVAGGKSYQLAKITVISPLQVQLPVPMEGPPIATVPTTFGYRFELVQGDLVYRGFCQHQKCRSQWKVGEDVRFRYSSENIYLQRPNGKELKLDLILRGKREADGTLTTIWRAKSLQK